ncbi:MAG: hypothetical protein LBR73_05745 [Oscillospiraceae bacterium]|jgi:predicted secreted hydrolase|nr:hypothetical protein [Oscillospiraceae bacterium]
MGTIVKTTGTGIPPRSFADEFLTHPKCSEWWYSTTYLEDGGGNRFACQFTLAQVNIWGIKFRLLITSVTDVNRNKHYNTQTPIFFGKGVTATDTLLSVDGKCKAVFEPNAVCPKGRIHLEMDSDAFHIVCDMNAVKPPVRHCDGGVLQMGIPGEKERTYYMSMTNLATEAELVLEGRRYPNLKGKTWFDRQGGTYTLTDGRTCWEWLSLRFFDDTETMIFAFPQDNYYDGTRIERDGSYTRLNDYTLEATDVITWEGRQFSNGWRLTYGGRTYTVTPQADGMFNVFFFELLADIKDEAGNLVGYAVVELLPGVRNKTTPTDAFRKK